MSDALKFHIAVSLLNNLLNRRLLSTEEFARAKLTLAEQYGTFF